MKTIITKEKLKKLEKIKSKMLSWQKPPSERITGELLPYASCSCDRCSCSDGMCNGGDD